MCSLGKLKTVKDFCAFRQREAKSTPLHKLALHNAEWAICPCTTHLSLSARNTKLGDGPVRSLMEPWGPGTCCDSGDVAVA